MMEDISVHVLVVSQKSMEGLFQKHVKVNDNNYNTGPFFHPYIYMTVTQRKCVISPVYENPCKPPSSKLSKNKYILIIDTNFLL